jgi:hypothetical protein
MKPQTHKKRVSPYNLIKGKLEKQIKGLEAALDAERAMVKFLRDSVNVPGIASMRAVPGMTHPWEAVRQRAIAGRQLGYDMMVRAERDDLVFEFKHRIA